MNPDLPNELGFLIVVCMNLIILVLCELAGLWALIDCMRICWKKGKSKCG
jgi:hypothetical protein